MYTLITSEQKPNSNQAWHMNPESLLKERRRLVTRGLLGKIPLLISGVGQCSMNVLHLDQTLHEAIQNTRHMAENPHVLTLQRQNYWKPRSPRPDGTQPWAGMGISHPHEAQAFFEESLKMNFALCSELGLDDHIERYAPQLTMGWIGSRNRNARYIATIANKEVSLPLPIKNDLDGDTSWALDMVRTCRTIRQHRSNSGAIVLLHRGGTTIATPELWEQSVLKALETTEGQMMLDLAHGAEQAHDPSKQFGKSVDGQIRALEHYTKIGERTGMWANGLLLEASDAPSDTDPNMPHRLALDGIAHIAQQMHSNPGAILE